MASSYIYVRQKYKVNIFKNIIDITVLKQKDYGLNLFQHIHSWNITDKLTKKC